MSPTGRRWGSVYFDRQRRKWRARAGDEERTSLGLYPSEREAWEAVAEAQRFEAHRVRATGPTAALVAFGRAWLEREELLGLRRGIDRERSRFEKHLATAPFASWPMAAITRGDVQRWIRELAAGQAEGPRGKGQRRSRRTVLAALNLLRAVFRDAIERGILDESPAAGVVVPREENTDEPLVILSPAEVELLRTTKAIPLRAHAAFLVAAFGGLRPGELWGLRWQDVRIGTRAELVVRFSRGRGTKGGRVRRVPLLLPAREALERWRAASKPKGLASLVWPAEGGRHHADGYDAGWQDRRQTGRGGAAYTQLGLRWRAGIGTRVPLKDLRHTAACHLLRGTWVRDGWIERPLRLEEVQAWLGHDSLTTTERYYARLAPGGLLDVVPAVRHLHAVERVEDEREGE